MTHSSLTVELAERSYNIFIGAGVLNQLSLVREFIPRQVAIVSNTTVAALYMQPLKQLLSSANPECKLIEIVLPDGEQFKNLENLTTVFDGLLANAFNRKCLLVALGGGVVGDMTGFAAACYQRGVDFIQVPTTLLSQVDSSVGGKTGVNHPLGKNMIGAFYQPKTVLIDTSVLASLPQRELSAGIAEVIKYGLIADSLFFDWLEQNIEPLMALDQSALEYAIFRSCALKAEVVAQDEHETGRRAILNLGHTYGHAIEAEMGYGKWLHGEAVAAGMVMACELSCSLGWLGADIVERTKALLRRAKLPVSPPETMGRASFEKYMKVDKKNLDGRIRLVLLRACGEAVVADDYDVDTFYEQLNALDKAS